MHRTKRPSQGLHGEREAYGRQQQIISQTVEAIEATDETQRGRAATKERKSETKNTELLGSRRFQNLRM